MKALVVHYKNKYPSGRVFATEESLDVYDAEGEHRIALRKNGAGQLVDCGAEHGAIDRHDMSPIPKQSRVFKLYADGRPGLSEEAVERKQSAAELVQDGKILSCEEYRKQGFDIDANGVIVSAPRKKEIEA